MPEALPATVRVRDLAKSYGAVPALRGVSFTVAAGETYGLLGRNGAGKTTALECVLGLRQPDAGSIRLEEVDAVAEAPRCRAFVGAVLQGATLQDKLTPRQALELFASFYEPPVAAGELLRRFGLEEKANAAFDTLSGGQRQRLLLALAFVNRPRILVLDEPGAGLDPQARRELHHAIGDLRAHGVTILLSTHDLQEAPQLCDRIGILHDGRIVADGSPAELIARSQAQPRLAVQVEQPLAAADLAALPGATDARRWADGWTIGTTQVNQTLAALIKHLETTDNRLIDLQVVRPTLEDVFIEITGRAWSETEGRP